jgi:nicotinamidase-related amidase
MANSHPPFLRSTELLSADNSCLLIVDVQEKLLPKITAAERVVSGCRRLIRGAQILGVPVTATEQYPQGLGPTVAELAALLPPPLPKLRFSCAEVLNWGGGAPNDRFQIVVAGIEAHVCVLQTALDLISQGFQVYIPADAVSSRNEFDWKMALERLAASGAVLTTTESVLFEWCAVAGTPEFKQISQLVKVP